MSEGKTIGEYTQYLRDLVDRVGVSEQGIPKESVTPTNTIFQYGAEPSPEDKLEAAFDLIREALDDAREAARDD